jgi:hypothetical protein
MTDAERAALLARPLTCHLGCLDPEGYPYVVPVWFTYADGGFYIAGRARSAWADFLERDGRVSLCIDGGADDPGARVLVKGTATPVEPVGTEGRWVTIARDMSVRYLGDDEGLAYFARTRTEPRRLFFVRPLRLTDWVGGWAGKYKHSNW